MQLQALAMIPVRGTVYIVKLPFVFVWRVVYFLYLCLYAAFASILRVPAFYAKKVYNRLVFTWGWTKLSVRHSLGLSRTPAITDGTQTLHPNDYLSEPVPGSAAAAYGHPLTEEDDPYLRSPYGPYKRPGHGGRRNKRDRRAMITHLLRLLLEPTSPVESDDETERAISARPAEHDEAEKALNLILDLVKLSKCDSTARDRSRLAPALKSGELEAILSQAKDREHLQALITELDQLAIDVDPARKNGVLSGHPSPSHMPLDTERPPSSGSMELCYTPTNPSSIVSSSDEYMDPVDDEELEDSSERHSYNYDGLSPVPESPEYLTASSESLRMNQLEDELTRALSNLTTAASGLNADQEMVESMETQITQKTVTVTESVGVQENDLESVPKTTPLLGVQVGHEKRQLGNARKSRPPSRKPQNKDSPTTDQQSDNTIQGDLDGASSSESDDDGIEAPKGESPRVKPPGGVRVLPPLQLTDQIQLLTSGSTNWPTNQSPPEDDEVDEPSSEPGSKVEGESSSRRDSTSSDTEKMKIPSNQPPWIEMRRRSSSSTSSTHNTSDSPVVVYTPPPRKTRVHSDPQSDPPPSQDIEENGDNLWDRDPTLDVTTGLYDTLQPKRTVPVYLHERIARHEASSVEPSPRLPPRNNLALQRTASADTITKPPSDRALQRRGSERHSSSTRESRRDKESRESSKERHDRSKESHSSKSKESSRDKSSRESRSKDKETRQSRSREKERHERHRSEHRSHSAERSERRHSSDSHHHRSRSGDRSSSQSAERHSSSHRHSSSDRHRHSSSDRHRSSSRDKHSSSASSSASKDGDGKFKLLSSPHSSKSRLATALFSRSSSKDKADKQKKTSSQKEGDKGKKSSKSEGSKKTSVKSSKRRGSTSSEKEDSPDTGEMPRSTSSTSIRSARAGSVYSFDSVISGRNNDL
ncbi:uncharacterized protein DDB_G0284459-like isoform X2 [Halichondria panicea]|uniref:uncharacterized protein DDB_G0284459-like isoform X2 n=1 Tax=Halichondria panicea TaxID=6063 RepID=UPI00312B2C27